jgi:hypothetical protein
MVDQDGTVATTPENCAEVEVGEGTLTLTSEDPAEPGSITLDVAELPRGARLVQEYSAEDDQYALYVVLMRADGAAILVLGEPGGEEAPPPAPVAVDGAQPAPESPTPAVDVEPAAPSDTEKEIELPKEPDALLDFMRQLTDCVFIAAREDDPPGDWMLSESLYAARVGSSLEDSQVDQAEVHAKVEALRDMIKAGMAMGGTCALEQEDPGD